MNTSCVLWTGRLDRDGYGCMGRRLAHRVIYEREVGPIPDGLVIDHLCRTRSCVNVAHMEPVTRAENNVRGFGFSGRNARASHCVNGHPFDETNTLRQRGARRCRSCNRQDAAEYRARQKAVA